MLKDTQDEVSAVDAPHEEQATGTATSLASASLALGLAGVPDLQSESLLLRRVTSGMPTSWLPVQKLIVLQKLAENYYRKERTPNVTIIFSLLFW